MFRSDLVKGIAKKMKEKCGAAESALDRLLGYGPLDMAALFAPGDGADASIFFKNNINVAEIIGSHLEETGILPDWDTIYHEAFSDFAARHGLEPGADIGIRVDANLNVHIYARDGLDPETVNEMESLFGVGAKPLKVCLPRRKHRLYRNRRTPAAPAMTLGGLRGKIAL